MSKIKVLHLVKSLGRGGAEMLLQETLKKHDLEKFEFHYIYFLPWKNQMVEGIEKAGGKVLNFPARNNFIIMLQLKKIISYVRQHEIDIIHCHLPWAGFAGRFIHKLTGIKVIYSEHNIQDRYHFITRIINKLTFNWQSQVVAVSNDVATSIRQSIHPKIPVVTILNGVNTDLFKRNEQLRTTKRVELGLKENEMLIGNIAVFRFQKRLVEWIDVLKEITDRFPHVKGCIVGDGVLKPQIMAHLKEKGMEEKIFFPGLQTDVMPWMSAMDIFMMTSSFEGLPIALLEAMSMECAVVSTDAGGIKEVIRDGIDGYLKPVSDWKELVAPAADLLSDPLLIKKFGQKARIRVEDSFSMNKMVAELESIYLEMASKNKQEWK